MEPLELPDRLIIFDGECELCSGLVRFVMRRDTRARLQFLAAQSDLGHRVQTQLGIDALAQSTLILVERGVVHLRSRAALGIAVQLDGALWGLWGVFFLVPAWLRDLLYRPLAQRRLAIFGKRADCMLATEETDRHFFK